MDVASSIDDDRLSFLGGGKFYCTIRPSARKLPMTTLTRCPGFTYLPLFEKAIQYALPVSGVLLWRNFPTFSKEGTTSLTPACGSINEGSFFLSLSAAAFFASSTR